MTADVKLRLGVSGGAEVNSELSAIERQLDRTTDAVRKVGHYGIGLAVVLPALQRMLSGAIAMADAVSTLDNRLKLSVGNAQSAAIAFDDLYKAAQSSRTSFTELGSVYATMARAGYANMTVVKAIGDAMAISGGSAASMQAALVQLGQGMASGVLRGEELNSILEQAPRLAQALADGLGVPVGALRRLGEEGQLTSQKVVEALTRSAPKLAEEVSKSTATVSQGMTVLGNSTTRLVGDLDKAVGGSKALADALTALASALDGVGSVVRNNQAAFSAFFAGIAGVAAVAGIKSLIAGIGAIGGAIKGLALTLAANPIVLAVLGIAAVAGAGYGIWSARARELDTYAGKVKRLAEIETQLERNRLQGFGERSIYGGDGENIGLRRERDRLKDEIAQRNTELRDQARRAEAGIVDPAEARRAELETQLQALRAKSAGITDDYTKTLRTLSDAYTEGLMPLDEYRKRVADLVATTQIGKSAADARKAALAEQARMEAEFSRATNDYLEQRERAQQKEREETAKTAMAALARYEAEEQAVDARLKSAGEMVQAIERETQLMGMSNIERELSIALWALEAKGIEKGSEAYKKFAAELREAIVAREGVRKAADDWKEESARIQRINDQIGQSLADALMNGGKSAAEYIKGLFRSMVLRPVIEAAVKPLAGMITGILGLGGSGAAMAGSGPGGGGNLLANAGGLMSLFGAGGIGGSLTAGAGWLTGATTLSGSLSAAGSLLTSGSGAGMLAGAGMGIGAVAPLVAAFQLAKMLNGGYKIGGLSSDMTTLLGGGLLGPLFGRKLKDTGVEGLFGASGDFGGSSYAYYKGGLFRSNKTVRSPLDQALEQVLDAGGKAAAEQAKAYAEALGLPVEALQGYSQQIKVSFSGMDEAAQKEAIQKLIVDFQEGLLGQFSAQLEPLRKVGETLAQTAGRLASLQTLSKGLNDLGGVFSRVAGLSIQAREQLVEFAGGMESLAGLARSYVENYFNRDEIAGLKAREISDVLAGVGIDASGLSTRGDFRTLVESLDVSGEQGRRQLTALLGVQGSFAGVSDYLAESGGTLGSAAAQAPQTAVLGSLFASSAAAQVDAINGVASGVAQTNQLLGQLIDAVQQQRTMLDQWQWEVNPGGGGA